MLKITILHHLTSALLAEFTFSINDNFLIITSKMIKMVVFLVLKTKQYLFYRLEIKVWLEHG